MQKKIRAFQTNHRGVKRVAEETARHLYDRNFDYGNLSRITRFTGTHPAVMKAWIARFDWKDQLRFEGPARSLNPSISKHDKTRYRLISWIEKRILGGRRLGEFRNYIQIR
jgi:hypothetical protein